MFTCKCLNIVVEVPSPKIEKFDVNLEKFAEGDRSKVFLQQELGIVTCNKINISQKWLVHEHQIGDWVVHQCINCNTFTYGTSKQNAFPLALVDIKLLKNTNEIAVFKKSDQYSPIFHMLIYRNMMDKISGMKSLEPISDNDFVVRGLQSQLNEAMEAETKATEERIKKYKEEQYAALEAFKDRSRKEYHVLAGLALTNQTSSYEKKVNETISGNSAPPSSSIKINSTFNDTNVIGNSKVINKPKHNVVNSLTSQVKRSSSSRTSSSKLTNSMRESYDSEVLFPLDGMDDNMPSHMNMSDNDSDTDDSLSHDDIQPPPPQRGFSSNLAKSLPMSVPTFMAAYNREMKDIDDDQVPEGPSDIAASIKALAKSVHGEAVFGDLPRPRLRTQI